MIFWPKVWSFVFKNLELIPFCDPLIFSSYFFIQEKNNYLIYFVQ